MEFGDAIDVLAEPATYVESVGAAGAGYMAPSIVNNLADRFAPMDLPDEAAGLAVIAGAEAADVPYKAAIQAGAGAYTAEKAAERFGIKNTVVNMGA